MEEIWKDLPNYEGSYAISNTGRVYSYYSKRIMATVISKHGYEKVNVYRNGVRKTINVHRLVALTHIPNDSNLECINHIDENKLNNNVKNLEWCTFKENSNHGTIKERKSESIRTSKLYLSSIKNKRKPVVAVSVSNGEVIYYDSAASARVDGFDSSTITKCTLGKKKTHHGYRWYKQSDYKQEENA